MSTVSFPFLSIVGHYCSFGICAKMPWRDPEDFFRKLCCPGCNLGDKELIPECKCPAYSIKENPPREALLAGQTTHSLMQMICILVLAPCLVTGWEQFMDRCLSSSTVNSSALQCRLQIRALRFWAEPVDKFTFTSIWTLVSISTMEVRLKSHISNLSPLHLYFGSLNICWLGWFHIPRR